MERRGTCAVFGCFPMRFAWGFDEEDPGCAEMKLELMQQIMVLRQLGVGAFLVACDPGVGLYAAEIVDVLRASDPTLTLFCLTPHEEQATKWPPYLRERYFTMLERCTQLAVACRRPARDAQMRAYRRIIDMADVVLAVCDEEVETDGAETAAMRYAAELDKPRILIHPDTFAVSLHHIELPKA